MSDTVGVKNTDRFVLGDERRFKIFSLQLKNVSGNFIVLWVKVHCLIEVKELQARIN